MKNKIQDRTPITQTSKYYFIVRLSFKLFVILAVSLFPPAQPKSLLNNEQHARSGGRHTSYTQK